VSLSQACSGILVTGGCEEALGDHEDLVLLAEELHEYLRRVTEAGAHMLEQMNKIFGPEKGESKWDPAKIMWVRAEGSKGPYDRSEDVDSVDFKAMVKDLAGHSGRLRREGYFYWTFKNGFAVGRKKLAKT